MQGATISSSTRRRSVRSRIACARSSPRARTCTSEARRAACSALDAVLCDDGGASGDDLLRNGTSPPHVRGASHFRRCRAQLLSRTARMGATPSGLGLCGSRWPARSRRRRQLPPARSHDVPERRRLLGPDRPHRRRDVDRGRGSRPPRPRFGQRHRRPCAGMKWGHIRTRSMDRPLPMAPRSASIRVWAPRVPSSPTGRS